MDPALDNARQAAEEGAIEANFGSLLRLDGLAHTQQGMQALARTKPPRSTGALGGVLNAEIPLGGLCLLRGSDAAAADAVLKVLAGVSSSSSSGARVVVDFLDYVYSPEVPVLLEGSILMNLLLSVSSLRNRHSPTEEEAWHVARRCGLSKAFLYAPEEFSVGRMGRNLPTTSRQAVALARCILADPDVLLLHKPIALLDHHHANKVLGVLSDFVHHGGLVGVLSRGGKTIPDSTARSLAETNAPPGEEIVIEVQGEGTIAQPEGEDTSSRVERRGTRTVIFTQNSGVEEVPSQCTAVLDFTVDDDDDESVSSDEEPFFEGPTEAHRGEEEEKKTPKAETPIGQATLNRGKSIKRVASIAHKQPPDAEEQSAEASARHRAWRQTLMRASSIVTGRRERMSSQNSSHPGDSSFKSQGQLAQEASVRSSNSHTNRSAHSSFTDAAGVRAHPKDGLQRSGSHRKAAAMLMAHAAAATHHQSPLHTSFKMLKGGPAPPPDLVPAPLLRRKDPSRSPEIVSQTTTSWSASGPIELSLSDAPLARVADSDIAYA